MHVFKLLYTVSQKMCHAFVTAGKPVKFPAKFCITLSVASLGGHPRIHPPRG